jgi:hypothetical protein
MLHLAVLLANPNIEIPAIELATGVAALGRSDQRVGSLGQPVLDRKAIERYRQRLSKLTADAEQLESCNEYERAAKARAEREWIVAELSAGTGFGGRTRRFPDNAERARVAVGKAIRRAITRIRDADLLVGEHLRRSVHTGIRCSYWLP